MGTKWAREFQKFKMRGHLLTLVIEERSQHIQVAFDDALHNVLLAQQSIGYVQDCWTVQQWHVTLDSPICKCRLGLGCVHELQFVQTDAVAIPHNRKHLVQVCTRDSREAK